ncbi:hypothetical protein Bca52824_047018 [Brassica carinata]|uniref:Uncharacterized protein n=1 Tax=Brassica carinata TaxID=52824 RepID=A0A8X7UQR5_BRACI|nr:hypothetical protein Bca52824_047018 [Brassica carinata]
MVVFPNPNREDPGKALRDWDLWGPFFFIVFLGLMLSWSPSVKKSEVFVVAFALLTAVAVILTLNSTLIQAMCTKQSERLSSVDLTQSSNCVSTVEIKYRDRWHRRYVKLGELEAELFVIKAIHDNL